MRIKKIAPETPANGNIENTHGTSQTDTYSQEYINGIIESGSNANGNYIKYIDGTLICYMRKRVTNIAISTAFGSMYINDTDIIFTFPQQFTERPTFNINVIDASTGLILNYSQSSDTKNYSDGYRIARPNTAPEKTYILNAIAIGKWK